MESETRNNNVIELLVEEFLIVLFIELHVAFLQ